MNHPFSYALPYASNRQPVLARNVVSTSQPLATQAGLRMLARGGSAVDAALATAIALTITEPCSNGLGSDLFCILWDPATRRLHGLNASGRAPAGWSPERFKGMSAMPRTGWDTVTIPGAVSGWAALSQRFGKLPFADLFEPGIDYARRGYLVSPIVATKWANAVPIFENVPGWAEHFMPHGRAPHTAELFQCEAMAHSMEKIAASRGETFYRGELAAAMVAHARSLGGAHTPDDFAGHTCDWVEPIGIDYRGSTIHEIPPNGQGIAALMALGMLENFDMASLANDSARSLHVQIEAMKLAFADAYRYVADPRTMEVTPAQLLDKTYLKERAKLIDPDRATHFAHGMPGPGGTVYLTAADESGMMVSLIQSNYQGFGSGIVVPGTGISLQNRGSGFSLQPGHPNLVGGGKRPFHTIIPGFMTRSGEPVLSFGIMGGSMQPQAHMQTMVRLLDYGQNPQACLDAPRWRIDPGMMIDLELQAADAARDGLTAMGHTLIAKYDAYMDFGAGQFAYRIPGGYVAASDWRRDGHAAGF
ncbi:MAG: gamma-glutamyltransferase family protein [Betaproteobacteria bacterium]|nr:gamma-glutamyltransferase family protein [Betaproteobacteria bacterium]